MLLKYYYDQQDGQLMIAINNIEYNIDTKREINFPKMITMVIKFSNNF